MTLNRKLHVIKSSKMLFPTSKVTNSFVSMQPRSLMITNRNARYFGLAIEYPALEPSWRQSNMLQSVCATQTTRGNSFSLSASTVSQKTNLTHFIKSFRMNVSTSVIFFFVFWINRSTSSVSADESIQWLPRTAEPHQQPTH